MPRLLNFPALRNSAPDWTPAPDTPPLRDREIHVWRANLDDHRFYGLPASLLSAAEIVRSARSDDPLARARNLTMHAMLRSVLARYTRQPASKLKFARDCSGRSVLALSTLKFNLTAADDLALLAVTLTDDIGLDLERIREDLPFDEMAAHFFEPRDHWSIRTTHSSRDKAARFFQLWTSQEAARHAGGVGSAAAHRFSPSQGFAAAVATKSRESFLKFWDWN